MSELLIPPPTLRLLSHAYHTGRLYFDERCLQPEDLLEQTEQDLFFYEGDSRDHLIYMEVLRGYKRAMRDLIDNFDDARLARRMVVKYGGAWLERFYNKYILCFNIPPVVQRLIKHYALNGTLLL